MWNLFSRIFLFAYDMLYRTSRRLFMFWTNSKRRIMGTMDEPPSSTNLKKNHNSSDSNNSRAEEQGEISTLKEFQSRFPAPVNKDVVINIEVNEFQEESKVLVDKKKYECLAAVQDLTQGHSGQQIEMAPEEVKEDVKKLRSVAEKVAAECLNAVGDDRQQGNSAKRIKLDKHKDKNDTLSVSTDNPNPSETKKKDKKGKKSNKAAVATNNSERVDSRPNYFVAIQVSDTTVKSKVREIQEGMLKKEITSESVKKKAQSGAVFKDTFVPVAKLHFTLHVFHLPDKDHLIKAQEIMEEVHSEIKQELESNPILFTIEGLGHFRNSVLFAKIKEPHHITRLEDLSTMLRDRFESASIFGDTKVFQPHMTIAKMSRSKKLHKLKIRSFPTELWSEYELEVLGTQRIEALQLLSMTESDPTSGYYRCVAHLPFS